MEAIDLFAGAGGERFWSKVDKSVEPDRCWPWLAANNGAGYGHIRAGGRNHMAHRVAYELMVGPIPDGLVLDHLCRNRACVNPDHLEPITDTENILRGESPPARNARKQRCPNGHGYTPRPDGTRQCLICRRARRIANGESSGRALPAERTHCPKGHPYDEKNTYLVKRPDGSIKQRMCRECMRQRNRERRARAKGGDAK